jgi:hypothetical protein
MVNCLGIFFIVGRDHVPRAASSFAGSKTIKRVAHKTTRYAGGCSSYTKSPYPHYNSSAQATIQKGYGDINGE